MMTFQEWLAIREGLWLSDEKAVEGLSKLPQPKPKKPPQRKPLTQSGGPAKPGVHPVLPKFSTASTKNGRPWWSPALIAHLPDRRSPRPWLCSMRPTVRRVERSGDRSTTTWNGRDTAPQQRTRTRPLHNRVPSDQAVASCCFSRRRRRVAPTPATQAPMPNKAKASEEGSGTGDTALA